MTICIDIRYSGCCSDVFFLGDVRRAENSAQGWNWQTEKVEEEEKKGLCCAVVCGRA